MNVLMFGWEFPPFISGGLGVACRGIAEGLTQQGVKLSFVLPTTRGQAIEAGFRILAADEVRLSAISKKALQKLSSRLEEFEAHFSGASPYATGSYSPAGQAAMLREEQIQRVFGPGNRSSVLDFSGNYGRNLNAEVAQYSVIGEFLGLTEEFDIIHAHDWLTFPAGVRAKMASGKPLVVHVHATEYDRSGDSMNMAVYDIEKNGMDQADKIIAVSYYTKNIIVNRYGIHPDKVAVVHNAVDRERGAARGNVRKPLNEKIVLFLGRVTMQKGPDYFLETAHRVLRVLKNVRFVMAGSGDMLPRLITRMASLKIADRFHFTGFLRGIDVETMYAMSDLYVMPSVSEPFGLTAFEALLYDVPLILSRQSGVSEILKDAVLVDFWDVDKLADRIVQLLTNETLARTIVDRCKEQVRHIGWENAGYRIKQVYESLL